MQEAADHGGEHDLGRDSAPPLAARARTRHHGERRGPWTLHLSRGERTDLGVRRRRHGGAREARPQRRSEQRRDVLREVLQVLPQRALVDELRAHVAGDALERGGDETLARSEPPVHARLVHLGVARDPIDADAVDSVLEDLLERSRENGGLDRLASRAPGVTTLRLPLRARHVDPHRTTRQRTLRLDIAT